MNGDGGYAALNLPRLVQVRAWKLLEASTVADALHAAGRAVGFALGTENEGA
jgi:hypothetical protein